MCEWLFEKARAKQIMWRYCGSGQYDSCLHHNHCTIMFSLLAFFFVVAEIILLSVQLNSVPGLTKALSKDSVESHVMRAHLSHLCQSSPS